MTDTKIPLIIIVGPTAVGKTALGVKLGVNFNGQIISADSRQFYRHMDIGTAKPTQEELTAIKHHLINIADPDETVGLAQFLSRARTSIAEIAGAGCTPFVVGGTGQYVKALVQGWQVPEVPPNPELRAELEIRAVTDPDVLWADLLKLDPGVQAFIDPRNLRRVIRAMEVCLTTGCPYSELRRRVPPPYRILQIGLTAERKFLYDRADQRVDRMMVDGLLREVKHLVHMGYEWNLPSMSGLGYSQFQPFLDGDATLEDVVERIKLDTHDFIRRQYNWFRLSNPDIHWFDSQHPDYTSLAEKLVSDFL